MYGRPAGVGLAFWHQTETCHA